MKSSCNCYGYGIKINILLWVIAIILNTKQKICESFTTESSRMKSSIIDRFSLGMAKNSDRARQERDLEDMMGDDWRVFRAKLITKEQEEAGSRITKRILKNVEERKHGRFANLFAAFFSHSQQKSSHESTQELVKESIDINILNADTIGGDGLKIDDPFATDEEKLAVNPRQVNFDKHRWAHPISHVETGCVLVANERLGGVFHRTVVLIIGHDEHTGSTGVCINRPMPGNLLKVGSETVSNLDLSLKMAFNTASVAYGGPVMQADYSILHGFGEVEGSKKIAPGIFVGGSQELMHCVRRNHFKPSDALFIKGHATWIPSQLSREVSAGVWDIASVSSDFILRYARTPKDVEDKDNGLWSDILMCMGGKYAEISRRCTGKGETKSMP